MVIIIVIKIDQACFPKYGERFSFAFNPIEKSFSRHITTSTLTPFQLKCDARLGRHLKNGTSNWPRQKSRNMEVNMNTSWHPEQAIE